MILEDKQQNVAHIHTGALGVPGDASANIFRQASNEPGQKNAIRKVSDELRVHGLSLVLTAGPYQTEKKHNTQKGWAIPQVVLCPWTCLNVSR